MSGGVQKRWLSVKSRIIRSYFEKKPRSRKKSKKVKKRIKLLQYDKKIHLPGEDHTHREREQGETFAAMRRQHPAVESAINNLEHRGLDRVRSKGRKGFARAVALAVVALNVHRLGRVLRQQAREQHRLAA